MCRSGVKRIGWFFALTVVMFGVRAVPAADPSSLLDGLTLYLPFDGQADAVVAMGSDTVLAPEAAFVPGRAGQAISGASPDVQVYHPGNANAARGTVAFWVRPDWLDDPEAVRGRQFFRFKWVSLVYGTDKRILWFMTGNASPPEGFRWHYGVASHAPRHWQPEEWHHLAFSWDASDGSKALYIDGELAARGTTDLLSDNNAGNQPVRLGTSATGSYDEWMIWDRVLSDDEVGLLAKEPETVRARLRADAPSRRTSEPAPWPLRFSIHVVKPPIDTIVNPGDPFTAIVPVANPADHAVEQTLDVVLLDFRKRERDRFQRTVTLAPGEEKTLRFTVTPPQETGVFKVAVQLERNGHYFERDVSAFACWPKPDGPPETDTFFGHHVNSWFGGAYIRQAARLGVGWVRGHDMLQATWWGVVQPEPGDFQWLWHDHIETYRHHEIRILGTLTGTPWWATRGGPHLRTRPGRGYSSPPKLDLWRTYCTETLKRYSPYIRYWEITNEPAVSGFWNGTPEEHAELVRIACESARSVDPDLTIMTAGYTAPAWRWHEANAKAGAWRDIDVLSVHLTAFGIPEIAAETLRTNLDHFRGLLQQYGPGRETPIWSTEGGMGDTTWFRGLDYAGLPPERLRSPMNAQEGAVRVVQGSAIMQSQGIRKHFIYLHNFPGHGARSYLNTSMIDVNNAPRPKLLARVVMARETDGARLAGNVHRLEDARFWAFVYDHGDGHSTVLWWCGDDGRATVAAPWSPGQTERIGIMGNAREWMTPAMLTGEPEYVRLRVPADQVLERLRSVPITVVQPPIPLPERHVDAEDPPDVPPLPDYVAPAETPAEVFTVDLHDVCNMGLADERAGDGRGGWSDEGPMNDLRNLGTGRKIFYGVPVNIIDPNENQGRSIVTLQGKNATPTLPAEVTIGLEPRRVRCLYFLHAAAWGHPGVIGKYIVEYTNGTESVIDNTIPAINGNWWTGWQQEERSRPVPVRVTNTSSGKPAWRYLRLVEWENPHPERTIQAIRVTSAAGASTPILLAITGVGR